MDSVMLSERANGKVIITSMETAQL